MVTEESMIRKKKKKKDKIKVNQIKAGHHLKGTLVTGTLGFAVTRFWAIFRAV